jgi:aryl-alcohol dehydrogenase-like predicted oxidoreductase
MEHSERHSHRGVSRRGFLSNVVAIAGGGLVSHVSGHVAGAAQLAATIPTRDFGRTGIRVPVVGLGAGSRFYDPIPDDAAAVELVRRAIDRGFAYLETSANYGPDGLSEKRLGLALATHRGKAFLETKVDARDYDGAMREMERSLHRLGVDHLDLVLHHFLHQGELEATSVGADRAIRRLVDEKVVRFRGFSSHDPSVALEALHRLSPDAVQLPINATRVPDFEREVLPAASARGVAVVAMKTCGHGYFFRENATKPDRIEQFGAPTEVLQRTDLPTPTEYLHYALSLPIAIAVVGMDSLHTLEGVTRAVATFQPLPATTMADVSARAQPLRTTGYWIARARPS